MAKEQGLISSTHTDEEYRKLRTRLDEMTRRADEAEQALRTAEANLAALQAGVDPDGVADPLDAVAPEGSEDATSVAGEGSPSEAVAVGEPGDAAGEEADPEDRPDEDRSDDGSDVTTVPVGGTWAASTQPSKGLSLRRLTGAGGRKGRGESKR
jgi:hypothetical protein